MDKDRNNMKVLVTGGAGFIGSHLCRRLVLEGHDVICMDDLSTGSEKSIEDLMPCRNFTFMRWDVTVPVELKIDQIFNLACPASPVHYQRDPVKTFRTSVSGALNMLELAKKNEARILQTSTSEVYGDPLVHPQTESYWGNVNPIGKRSCYDEGKRGAETLFFDYHRQYGVDIRVVRIFNTYGPFMAANDGRVVSNFIVEALKGNDLVVYGNGAQTRSFCYVSDTVEAIMRMMKQESTVGPVNIGNPDERTVLELAQMIIEKTGSKSRIVYRELPADDPARRKPDITSAQEYLKWSPVVSIDEGLSNTIAYFGRA
ncbi:MAG: SDR family oxidoreductase [Oscillospiraceae bacterium]|nr:SDR family oxidoreductase [Oscillospiraceae bacterium]